MGIHEELERLAKLHQAGALSDEEFAAAKNKVLTDGQESLGKAANKLVKLMAGGFGISILIILAFFFLFFLPQWQKMGAEREMRSQQFDEHFQKSRELFTKEFDKNFNQGPSLPDPGARQDQAQ